VHPRTNVIVEPERDINWGLQIGALSRVLTESCNAPVSQTRGRDQAQIKGVIWERARPHVASEATLGLKLWKRRNLKEPAARMASRRHSLGG